MATYAQLKKQMEQLAKQAEAALRAEKEVVLAKVRDAVSSFALTVDEVFGAGGKKKAKSSKTAVAKRVPKGAGQAKYVDPKTGATWSGFGRAPGWIASAKDRTKFLVGQQPAAAPAAPAKAKVAAKAAKPATKQVVSSKGAKTSAPAKKVAKAPAAATAKQATSPVAKAPAKKAAKTPSKPKIAMPAKTAAPQPKKAVTKASAPAKKPAPPKKPAASTAEAPVAEAPGVVQTASPAETPLA